MNRILVFIIVVILASFTTEAQQVDVDNRYENGQLEAGFKIGVWEYLGLDKTLELKIDYDNGKLIYIKADTSKYLVMLDSEWVFKNVSPHPRYVGSYIEFYKILASNLKYPANARRKNIEKTVFLEFVVDTNGRAVNLKILNDDEDYFATGITNAFNLVPNIWLTPNYNGYVVPAKFILPFYFKLTGGKQSLEYDLTTLNKLEGKKLQELIVSAPRSK